MVAKAKKNKESDWGAWVNIKWKPGTPESAWKELKKLPEIKEAWSTSGSWDCALWVNFQSPDQIEDFVWKTTRQNKWVEKTKTSWAKKWW